MAQQAIGQPFLRKALFEYLGLLAGAYQHAEISETACVGRALRVLVRLYHIGPAHHAADLPHYGNAFGHFARGRIQPQRLADVPRSLQVQGLSVPVVCNHRASRSYNGLCRAVIGRELQQARPWELLGQRPEILRISATEAINRLIRITDHKQPLAVTRQDLYETILHGIDILELVYQDVGEMLADLRRGLAVSVEPRETIEQDIVVVTRPVGVQLLLIRRIGCPEFVLPD